MWGEIDLPVKGPLSPSKGEQRENDREQKKCYVLCSPVAKQEQPHFQEEDVSSSVSAMLEAVVLCGTSVKSQQVGEVELTPQERRRELLQQFRSKPLVFLERYHTYLKPQHLTAFDHVCSDPRSQHYSKVILERAARNTDKTRVRNHRYAALQALQKDGKYFSDEQMRKREPLLYEQYIGQYLTDEEVFECSQKAMQDDGQCEGAGGHMRGLAALLLKSYDERLIQDRLQQEREKEEEAEEEEEEEDYEEDDDGNDKEDKTENETLKPSSQEKSLLREEFISQMHQRFLDGKDKDFIYSEVDDNPDYDNLDIVNRDEEEKYFDDDDVVEEEEEESMSV